MSKKRVLRSALLLSLLAAGLTFSDRLFAQGDAAPAEPDPAGGADGEAEPQELADPDEPAVDAPLTPAQAEKILASWLKYWQRPAVPPLPLPQPFPPQSEKELAYLEDLLTSWEDRSAKVETYRTDFSRWVTDPVFGPADAIKTFSKGEIRYESPDKCLIRIDSTGQSTPAAQAGGKPTYPDMGDAGREQWILNGKSLFEFDYAQELLVERQLPPEMHGKAIADARLPLALGPFSVEYNPFAYAPFPFLFDVKKEAIQSRFWLRATGNKQAQEKGEYWLEAFPKHQQDAVHYAKIEIIIAGSDFQVSAIKIHERNGAETIYQFTDRSSNWNLDLAKRELWRSEFHPSTPAGWERRVERVPGAPAADPVAQEPAIPSR